MTTLRGGSLLTKAGEGRLSSRRACLALAMLMSTVVSFTLIAGPAQADDLTDKRDKVNAQLRQSKQELDQSSKELSDAAAGLDDAQKKLTAAQEQLAKTKADLLVAQKHDQQMAKKLADAQDALEKAKADVVAGQKALDAEKQQAGDMVRDQYQQQTNLLPIAMVLSPSTADIQTRLQWSTTMFDTTQAQLDRLAEVQRQLDAKKAKQTEIEKQVAKDRSDAAAALEARKKLQQQAEDQQAAVTTLVKAKADAQARAQSEVEADQKQYEQLTQERAAVDKRIAERVAKAKAEAAAAKKRKEAQEARDRAAREAAAAKKKSSKSSSSSSSKKSSTPKKSTPKKSSSSGASRSSAHHGFIYPVVAPITSPFGMRVHPVTGVYKLHDGTDFGAGCGVAIKAAYSGRVTDEYYNAGYGNRLMIDHGTVDGRYVTTGYNHAIRYIVSVGQRVSQGQTIGYVGQTGYATGCHLHLMVWLDGQLVNPMTWY